MTAIVGNKSGKARRGVLWRGTGVAALFLGGVACSGSSDALLSDPNGAALLDAGVEAAPEAGDDAGPDVPFDSVVEVGVDASQDVSTDVAVDVTGDAPADGVDEAAVDAPVDAPVDPCAASCGNAELCDGIHAGLDDDCDGEVDEGCPCTPGLVQGCFRGDPAYRQVPGCFAGQQSCSPAGVWGVCSGGVHATSQCYVPQPGCHPVATHPFVPVHLNDGTGTFSADALSATWSVQCPPGAGVCPGVSGSSPQDVFQPLQPGEYTVHYTKTTANGTQQCSYPLFVGYRGLTVDLDWEHDLGSSGVDLDLHVHKPADTTPWKAESGSPVDCAWDNCTAQDFSPPTVLAPDWFSGIAPPDPVDWYLDPILENNPCYFAPLGRGALWQSHSLGCHSPRLDLDNILCNPSVVDPSSDQFCFPESATIDFPPVDQWIRIGVHYYSSAGLAYNVHPHVRVVCNGEVAADLGRAGFDQPVTFAPQDDVTRFWLVADVKFVVDQCGAPRCVVAPLYADALTHTPLLTTVTAAQSGFTPPYPP